MSGTHKHTPQKRGETWYCLGCPQMLVGEDNPDWVERQAILQELADGGGDDEDGDKPDSGTVPADGGSGGD